MDTITYSPIGVIHSPYKNKEGMPIQPVGAEGIVGIVVLDPKYAEGLNDLEGFSHIILFYHFHRSDGYALTVKPFLDDVTRGVFATRVPKRPNSIGFSIVRLLEIKECTLFIEGVDILDNTPLLDIKPFVPEFDSPKVERTGWFSGKTEKAKSLKSDNRF